MRIDVANRSGLADRVILGRVSSSVTGGWGVEARIQMNGQLLLARLFPTRQRALEWAERERRGLLGLGPRPWTSVRLGLRTFAVVAAVVMTLILISPRVGFAY